jgi:hypothetical protein
MGHCQREMIFDRLDRAFEAASAAIPAFVGIMNDGLLGAFRPAKNITRADIITVSTLDAFVIG